MGTGHREVLGGSNDRTVTYNLRNRWCRRWKAYYIQSLVGFGADSGLLLLLLFLADWLNWFNAELSPKRNWREPRSPEVGEEGDCT